MLFRGSTIRFHEAGIPEAWGFGSGADHRRRRQHGKRHPRLPGSPRPVRERASTYDVPAFHQRPCCSTAVLGQKLHWIPNYVSASTKRFPRRLRVASEF